jgi:hypothetical protein
MSGGGSEVRLAPTILGGLSGGGRRSRRPELRLDRRLSFRPEDGSPE